MTTLGKVFVFIQFILSIGALVAAVVIFSFHIRSRDKDQNYFQPEIKKHSEQIAKAAEARDRAEAKWLIASQQVQYVEAFRPQAQAWYAAKLALARTGRNPQNQPVPNPVQALEYQQSDPKNIETRVLVFHPDFSGKTPIQHRERSVADYETIQQSLRSRQKVIQAQQLLIEEALRQYSALTVQLMGAGQVKGLYAERKEMEEKRKRAIEEQESLKPSLANRYSEAVLALKRQNSLLQRKQELEKIGVAAGNRP